MDTAGDLRTIGFGAVLAATVLVLAGFVLVVGRATEASAVSVEVGHESITVHVRDVIEEPEAVIELLRTSGVPASIEPAAAPDELDGAVVSVGTIGTDAVVTFDDDDDGAIDRIVVAPDFAGSLVLAVGDVDAPVGAVAVAAAPVTCGELIDRTVRRVEADVTALGAEIRWYRAERDPSGGVIVTCHVGFPT